MVPLRFASLGFDYVVCVSKIWMVIRFDSKQGYKIYRAAKRDDRFVDFTFHRKTKSLIVMDNNTVIGCAFSVGTVYRRIMRACNETIVFDNRDTFVEPGADEELNDCLLYTSPIRNPFRRRAVHDQHSRQYTQRRRRSHPAR